MLAANLGQHLLQAAFDGAGVDGEDIAEQAGTDREESRGGDPRLRRQLRDNLAGLGHSPAVAPC